MARRITRTLALLGVTIAVLAGGSAAAIAPPGASAAPSEVGDRDERGWRYDTDYVFPLTRHMDEAGIPLGWRIPLYPFTVAFDLFQLPVGAIAGLFGD